MTVSAQATVTPPVNSPFHHETVVWVKHWTDRLFSFAITRPPSFRFRSGEFVMIGLPGEAKPILRAYSIASPNYAEDLEFLSIKVPDGPLTSRLQHIQPGDTVLLGKKPTGTLVHDALKPGKRLYLLGTGTGLAPWLSVARDHETYEKFDKVIIGHGVREVAELCYRDLFTQDLMQDELIGEMAQAQFMYYPTVTREPFQNQGRLTTLIETGKIFQDLGFDQSKFDPETDRVMLCGSMDMIKDLAKICEDHGLIEGSNAEPGDFVLERAFVG
jgi:ferredoxin--NADP+ reductase